MNCYCCKIELSNENSSEEHILLNAIGGKLKSKKLLCKTCNSEFGKNFDSTLSQQFLFLSSFLNIDRERGEHPILKGATTQNGEEIHLLSGGKPYYSKPVVETITNENEVVINIKARNTKELNQIANGLNRKYPQVSAEDIISKAIHKTGYLNEPIKINQKIGGEKALNGILKIAINYFVYVSNEFESLISIIEILKKETKNELCKHFYSEKLYKKESKEICHLIHIESNKYRKNIVAYIELFSSYSFIILLNDNYSGQKVKSTYCYDLNHKKQLTKEISLTMSTEEFHKLPVISANYYPIITGKMDRIVKIGLEKQTDSEILSISSRCIDDILKTKYGHEKIINEQMVSELSNHLATEFVKFIYRDLK